MVIKLASLPARQNYFMNGSGSCLHWLSMLKRELDVKEHTSVHLVDVMMNEFSDHATAPFNDKEKRTLKADP